MLLAHSCFNGCLPAPFGAGELFLPTERERRDEPVADVVRREAAVFVAMSKGCNEMSDLSGPYLLDSTGSSKFVHRKDVTRGEREEEVMKDEGGSA